MRRILVIFPMIADAAAFLRLISRNGNVLKQNVCFPLTLSGGAYVLAVL